MIKTSQLLCELNTIQSRVTRVKNTLITRADRWGQQCPAEILIAVLEYLPALDIARCTSVCQLWHQLPDSRMNRVFERKFCQDFSNARERSSHCEIAPEGSKTSWQRRYGRQVAVNRSWEEGRCRIQYSRGPQLLSACDGWLVEHIDGILSSQPVPGLKLRPKQVAIGRISCSAVDAECRRVYCVSLGGLIRGYSLPNLEHLGDTKLSNTPISVCALAVSDWLTAAIDNRNFLYLHNGRCTSVADVGLFGGWGGSYLHLDLAHRSLYGVFGRGKNDFRVFHCALQDAGQAVEAAPVVDVCDGGFDAPPVLDFKHQLLIGGRDQVVIGFSLPDFAACWQVTLDPAQCGHITCLGVNDQYLAVSTAKECDALLLYQYKSLLDETKAAGGSSALDKSVTVTKIRLTAQLPTNSQTDVQMDAFSIAFSCGFVVQFRGD